MHQLLWIETLLKLAGGGVLVLAPVAAARFLGLAPPEDAFWPRLLGAVLVGIAAATFVEGALRNAHGLGLPGAIVINLASAAMLTTLLILGKAAPSRRGKAVLWLLTAALLALSFLEIASA